jgi:octaprenyl-diphosphate synthase
MDKAMKLVRQELDEVNDFIAQVFVRDLAVVKVIAKQVLNGGGKRMRPILLLLSAKLYRGITPDAVGAASIIEVIHGASLLHDDVVDNTDKRRGIESLNARFNNKISVLLGDLLFTRAYARLSRFNEPRASMAIADAVATMSRAQFIEAYYQGDMATSVSEYLSIIEGKTATLFSSSTKIGAIIGGAPRDDVKKMAEFGKLFGIAYQIVDDCLNFWGDERKLGKPVGSDIIERQYTLPFISLLDRADEKDRGRIKAIVCRQDLAGKDIEEIIALMEKYEVRQHSYDVAGTYCRRARQELEAAPEGEAREALFDLIDYVVARDK